MVPALRAAKRGATASRAPLFSPAQPTKPIPMSILKKTGLNQRFLNKKIPTSKKQQIKIWLEDVEKGNIVVPPELLLRTYLSLGKAPPPHILQGSIIGTALGPKNISRQIKKLCRISQIIEADASLSGLLDALKKSYDPKTGYRMFGKIISDLQKDWMQWVDKRGGILAESTQVLLMNLFTFLLMRAMASSGAHERTETKRNKESIGLMETLSVLSLELASRSTSMKTLTLWLEQVGGIGEKHTDSFIEDVVYKDKNRIQLFEQTIERIPSLVEKLAHDGHVESMKAIARSMEHIPGADAKFRETLQEIWNSGPGVLTEEVQTFIRSFLKMEHGNLSSGKLILADPSEGLHIHHLATALMCSWEAREETPRTSEAFSILYGLAQKVFKLKIYGDVGNTVQFDPKIHELRGVVGESGNVTIRRPRVEWSDGSHSRVIIRAIVE